MIYSDPIWTVMVHAILVATVGAIFGLGLAETAKAAYRRLTRRPVRGGRG